MGTVLGFMNLFRVFAGTFLKSCLEKFTWLIQTGAPNAL